MCALQVTALINHKIWVEYLFVQEKNKYNVIWRILLFTQKFFLPLEIIWVEFLLPEFVQDNHS